MSTILGPNITGTDVGLSVTGKTRLDFTNYGQSGSGPVDPPIDPPTGPGGAVEFQDVLPYRNNTLKDPTGGSILAVSGVSAGVARVRPDGLLDLDLSGLSGQPFVTGSYLRVGGTAPGAVTFVCFVRDGLDGKIRLFGMAPGEYYRLEIDANDAVVVEPTENVRFLYISPTGFSKAEIESPTRENIGNASNTWLRDNFAKAQTTPGRGFNPGGALRYGESPELALNEERGQALALLLTQNVGEANVWLLFERGGTYSIGSTGLWAGSFGYSKLHPAYIGAYGTGARPRFTNPYSVGSWGSNVVLQDMHLFRCGGIGVIDASFTIVDNLYREGPSQNTAWATNGQGGVCRANTLRRAKILDTWLEEPARLTPPFWGTGSRDRQESMYISASQAILVEKIFIDQSGWQRGYPVTRSLGGLTAPFTPQSPNNQAHGGYIQGDNSDVNFVDALINWPSFAMVMGRSLGYAERIVGWGQNGPFLFGSYGQLEGTIVNAGYYAYGADVLITEPGQKQYIDHVTEWEPGQSITTTSTAPGSGGRRQNSDGGVLRFYVPLTTGTTGTIKPTHTSGDASDGNIVWRADTSYVRQGFGVSAVGFNNQNVHTHANRFIVAHATPGTPITSQDQVGPIGRAEPGDSNAPFKPESDIGEGSGGFGSHRYGMVRVANWLGRPADNLNLDGLNMGAIAATTISAWHQQEYGVPDSGDRMTIRASLRAEEAPWEKIESILRFFMGPFGWGSAWTPRTSPTTVTFLPSAYQAPGKDIGGTPGFRADCRDDWTTLDLPGTVAGDNVSLGGYDVLWDITPKNALGTFRFAGGELRMMGGILKPASFVDAGAIRMSQGSKLYIDGHAGDVLSLDLTESRFLNSGAAANIDIVGRYRSEVVFGYDGSSFTISPERSVTLYGDMLAGFDGEAGGAASLTVQGALHLRPGVRLSVSMLKEQYENGRTSKAEDGGKMCVPRLGTIVEGVTSGARGRVVEWIGTAGTKDYLVDNARALIVLDEIQGVFQNGEQITGARSTGIIPWPDGVLGTINAVPVYTLPKIRPFATGIGRRRVPSVVSAVNLGGTLTVDTTGLSPGTYTLIEAGTLVGDFASKPAAVTKVGNQVRLTVPA